MITAISIALDNAVYFLQAVRELTAYLLKNFFYALKVCKLAKNQSSLSLK